MFMSKLWIYNTECPYGIEKNGTIQYFKVLLNESKHDFIMNAIREREEQESKKLKAEVVSSLRKLKDGDWLLRLRLKSYRNHYNVKMDYREKTENYLKTFEEISSEDRIDTEIKLGGGFLFNWNGESRVGLDIYLEKVVV